MRVLSSGSHLPVTGARDRDHVRILLAIAAAVVLVVGCVVGAVALGSAADAGAPLEPITVRVPADPAPVPPAQPPPAGPAPRDQDGYVAPPPPVDDDDDDDDGPGDDGPGDDDGPDDDD